MCNAFTSTYEYIKNVRVFVLCMPTSCKIASKWRKAFKINYAKKYKRNCVCRLKISFMHIFELLSSLSRRCWICWQYGCYFSLTYIYYYYSLLTIRFFLLIFFSSAGAVCALCTVHTIFLVIFIFRYFIKTFKGNPSDNKLNMQSGVCLFVHSTHTHTTKIKRRE